MTLSLLKSMLPESVQVTEESGEIVLQMERDAKLFRRVGAFVLCVGLLLPIPLCVLLYFLGALPGMNGGAAVWFVLAPILVVAAAAIVMGIVLLRTSSGKSSTRIGINAFSITIEDRFLWIRRQENIPRSSIRSLIVEPLIATQGEAKKQGTGYFATLGQIRALLESGASKRFAMGYPKVVLTAIVEELARHCRPAGADEAPVDGPESLDGTHRVAVRLDRPAASPVTCEEHPDGVTLIVPPPGIWKGSKGLMVFAVIWLGFTGFIFLAMLAGAVQQNNMNWLMTLPLVFVVIGVVFLLIAMSIGRQRAVLAVVSGRLMVMRSGLFRNRRFEWERDELREIKVGPSNITVNKAPLMQMQIVPLAGKSYKLLTGRDELELDWMAAMLRRSLWPGESKADGLES